MCEMNEGEMKALANNVLYSCVEVRATKEINCFTICVCVSAYISTNKINEVGMTRNGRNLAIGLHDRRWSGP